MIILGTVSADAGYVHQVWTVRDGLPVNSVTDVVQSRQGYLWLTTFDGLVRFDGVRFVRYADAGTPGLGNGRLSSLLELPSGKLLLLSEAGDLSLFDPAAGRARPLSSAGRNQRYATIGPEGEAWVMMRPGLARLRGDRLEPVAPELLGPLDIVALSFDRTGGLWLGTLGKGVWHLPAGSLRKAPGGARTPITASPVVYTMANGLGSDHVRTLMVARDGTVWAGSDRGVDAIRRDGISPVLAAGKPWQAYLHAIAEHPRGGVLLGTETGLFFHHQDHPAADGPGRVVATDRFRGPIDLVLTATDGAVWMVTATTVLRDGVPVFHLPNPDRARIRAMTFDHEGNVWLATTGGGLHQLRRAVFQTISVEEGLSAREVYSLAEDGAGGVWIGTQNGGLNHLAGGTVRTFGAADGLLDDNIKAILHDRADRLWVGTYEAGLFRREGRRFVPEPLTSVYAGKAPLRVFALFEDHAGALWAGTSGGLLVRRAGRWDRVDAATAGEVPVTAIVRVIREAPGGTLWVGTHGAGVGRWTGNSLTWWTANDGLASNRVRDLHVVDGGNAVWIVTEDRGLSRLTLAAGGGPARVVSVGIAEGLPDSGIHQMLPDGHGWLWLSTNHGIFRVEERVLEDVAAGRRRLGAELFTERDGMRNREANGGVQGAAIRTRDGRVWFATVDGVVVADPDPKRLTLPPVAVAFEGLTANAREHRLVQGLTLVPDDRSFRVDYTGFSLSSPERLRFRYRLDGFDRDWVEVGNRRSAFFTNVPRGSYRFRLQASNNAASEMAWAGDEAVVALTVRPYFYETLWFRALLGLVALVLLFIAHLLRTGWLERQRRELTRQVELRTRELAAEKTAAVQASVTIAAQAEQLRELDRQKSRFFTDISHELRTPLTLIIGPLEDVQRDLHGDPIVGDATGAGAVSPTEATPVATSTAITGAIRNAHSLLDLTNQLLDLAKLESGKFELDTRREDLVAFLRTSAERFAPLARQRGIAFQHVLPAGPVLAEADRRQLARVIDNLLSNAFKFTPRGGWVRLTLSVHGSARIDISDSGPGIAAAHLPRIFERFYQADDPGGRLQPGTGIGLALVRELTTLHGGELEVHSAVGVGTSFTVVLPLAEYADAEYGPAAVTDLVAATGDPLTTLSVSSNGQDDADHTTILVVDDEPEIRAYLRRHLEPRYRVLEAGDGEAALVIVRQGLPDLVVADLMMPRLDGFGLCRAMKSDPELDFVPFILLTARSGTDDRLEGLGALADDYLTKPFDARELVARVDNLIALRRKLRDRFATMATMAMDPVAEEGAVVPGPSEDESYRRRLFALIDEHLSDEDFRVADLARLMVQDRTHLFRRTRELTGAAPSDLIRTRRLARAAELLRAREGQVGEVAYAVGFNSVSYFIKCFREDYGLTPAKYASEDTSPAPTLAMTPS